MGRLPAHRPLGVFDSILVDDVSGGHTMVRSQRLQACLVRVQDFLIFLTATTAHHNLSLVINVCCPGG